LCVCVCVCVRERELIAFFARAAARNPPQFSTRVGGGLKTVRVGGGLCAVRRMDFV